MPFPYQIWLRQQCLDYLGTLKTPERKRLLGLVESLGRDFNREGDFKLRGSDGRDWQVMVVGPHTMVIRPADL